MCSCDQRFAAQAGVVLIETVVMAVSGANNLTDKSTPIQLKNT